MYYIDSTVHCTLYSTQHKYHNNSQVTALVFLWQRMLTSVCTVPQPYNTTVNKAFDHLNVNSNLVSMMMA